MTTEWVYVQGVETAAWERCYYAPNTGLYVMEWRDKPGQWWVSRDWYYSNNNSAGPFETPEAAKAAYLMILEGDLP